MGRLNPDPVHSSGDARTGRFKPWILEPHIVLRRATARFFGKILKVDLIVTLNSFPKLPALCTQPDEARRRLDISAWISLVMAGVSLLACGSAWAQQLQFAPPAAPGQTGPAESIYRKNAVAPAAPVADPVTAAVAAPVADQAAQAERIVAAALAAMGRVDSISARVRQRVRVDDRVLVGAGRYVQSGLGEDQRYRYESSMKSDTETFDLLEVCDGLFAWSYRRIGPQAPQLERLDVRRIRERLHQLRPADDVVAAPYLGGVQRTLTLTRDWFRFTTVEPTAIDDLPVWRIEGRWCGECLALLLPSHKEAALKPGGITAAELPDGMPWSVRLSIGKRDLFPFRIEWLAIPGRRPVADREPEPVAVLELYDVRLGEPVDAAAFVYKPAIEGLIDHTEARVKHLAPMRP
jgi:hypothetical protein